MMNDRQKAFADYYIEYGNAAEAARKAGYSANTARQMGKENLTKPYILEYIVVFQIKRAFDLQIIFF